MSVRPADVDKLKRDIVEFKTSFQSTNQDYMTGYISALSVVEGMIAILPTLTLDDLRPKGRWVDKKNENVRCSVCQCHPLKDMDKDSVYYWKYEPDFCPNCGTDMRARTEE